MDEHFETRIRRAKELLAGAECILIGGGAGLSSAAGLAYGGVRFREHCPDFMQKYGMTDMYSAGFYPFDTQEEKWAYWSRHILLNRWDPPAMALYRKLYELVRGKNYFVITTNVDAQFEKAGFDPERLFAVQGDYGLLQCAKGCHETLYPNEELMREMAAGQADCRIPSALVPKCPVCGGDMEVHIRKDAFFTEDDAWESAAQRYDAFVEEARTKKTLLLELGVGFNTPGIIRFPFERLALRRERTRLIRINLDDPGVPPVLMKKSLVFSEDLADVLTKL